MITWLEGNGVPFEGSLCPYKTSYPSDPHYLYYSGSEAAGGFRDAAKPAPRGHRVKGPGTSGKTLMTRLKEAVRERGIRVLTQTHARSLLQDDGRVTGLVADTLRDAPAAGAGPAPAARAVRRETRDLRALAAEVAAPARRTSRTCARP